jgi:hypothetical protein
MQQEAHGLEILNNQTRVNVTILFYYLNMKRMVGACYEKQ